MNTCQSTGIGLHFLNQRQKSANNTTIKRNCVSDEAPK